MPGQLSRNPRTDPRPGDVFQSSNGLTTEIIGMSPTHVVIQVNRRKPFKTLKRNLSIRKAEILRTAEEPVLTIRGKSIGQINFEAYAKGRWKNDRGLASAYKAMTYNRQRNWQAAAEAVIAEYERLRREQP